jgi:hypothetical protein
MFVFHHIIPPFRFAYLQISTPEKKTSLAWSLCLKNFLGHTPTLDTAHSPFAALPTVPHIDKK